MRITKANSLKTIASAVEKFRELIAPTYGPAGKKVLIATNEFNLKAADDGHAAAVEFELEDEFENAVIMYIKEATAKTNSRVGDGTTTAVLLTSAIVQQVMGDIDDPFARTNYHKEAQEIAKATKEAIAHIKDKSKKIKSKQELYKIAYNSYNNEEVAGLISETLFKIGVDGILSIEDSQTANTEVEMVEGLEIQKGFASPYLINTSKEEVSLDNPAFILINGKVEGFMNIVPLLKQLVEHKEQRNFVIFGDGFGEDVLNAMILHRMKGVFNPLLVEIPGFGDNKLENLKNIAAVTGATIIEPKTTKYSEVGLEYVGTAKKAVAKKDKTTIIGGIGKIADRIEALEEKRNEVTDPMTKENIDKWIASLKGGIALIKVGANTENEQKSIKMKVEDAVNATKVAFKDGIVKGAGKTFSEIKTSSQVLNKALKAPEEQLKTNGEEFLDENVTDPAGVLIAALETASSIACGLLTMGGIIVTKRKEEKE